MTTTADLPHSLPLALLAEQLTRLSADMDGSGRVLDPLVNEPTQYGTAYFAYAAAVASAYGPAARQALVGDAGWWVGGAGGGRVGDAVRAMNASLDHLSDLNQSPWISGIDPVAGGTSRLSHRDFFWPAVMETFRRLREAQPQAAESWAERIAGIDIEATFITRPPSNWSAVWLSGEWLRMSMGLSPIGRDQFERWLGGMFEWIDVEQGFFAEPGLPNAYDLFTRLHLLRLLEADYDGPLREALFQLAQNGVSRSLAVQLSDGSVASSHRSAGHAWTLTAQIALFTRSARLLGDRAPEGLADAARLAFDVLSTCRRPDGSLNPVQNGHSHEQRIGYEGYSSDGHYTPLTLAFLAEAIDAGFDVTGNDPQGNTHAMNTRDEQPAIRVDRDPIWRAVLRRGSLAAQVRGGEANDYDGVGLTDLTLGPARRLVWHGSFFAPGRKADRPIINPGACLLERQDKAAVPVASCCASEPISLQKTAANEVTLCARSGAGHRWSCTCTLEEDQSLSMTERTEDGAAIGAFVLPYLLSPVPGEGTRVEVDQPSTAGETRVVLTLGPECVVVTLFAEVDRVVHLNTGWASRRGEAGLLRFELADPHSQIRYQFRSMP